jgi:hypothetical protein
LSGGGEGADRAERWWMESAWERCSESPKRSARVTHLVRIPESLPRGIHRGGGVPAGHSPLELPGGQHRAANCDADAPNPRAEADQGGWFIVTQRIFPDDHWQTVSGSRRTATNAWTRLPEARTSMARKHS